MEQLEKHFYSLDELSEITATDRKSKNFKRDVENALTRWGYGYDWFNRRGATITDIPTTPEERFQEILVRKFHVDIQVDMLALACYITAFTDIEGFDSMPWKEREHLFRLYYGRKVDEKTLRKWCQKLIEQEIISKDLNGTCWKTETIDNRKIRSPATEQEFIEYKNRRTELLDELTQEYKDANAELSDDQARKEAWGVVYSLLWAEYQCCYYFCKQFRFKAWNEQGEIIEIIELAKEINEKRCQSG